LIPFENQIATRLWFHRLGLNKNKNRLVLSILPIKMNTKIYLDALSFGLQKLFNNDFNAVDKQIVIITDGRDFGVSKVVGDVIEKLKRKNILLIGLNSLQNILSKDELNLEVYINSNQIKNYLVKIFNLRLSKKIYC